MSPLRTIALAVAFAALSAWMLLVEGWSDGRPPPPGSGGEKIVDCAKRPITALEVAGPRGGVVGRRAGERWTSDVEAAKRDRAGLALADLAGSLCDLPILDRIPEPGALADYGLEPPAFEIRVGLGETRATLDLGRATPAHNLLYARFREEREVLAVGILLRHEVEKVLAAAGG